MSQIIHQTSPNNFYISDIISSSYFSLLQEIVIALAMEGWSQCKSHNINTTLSVNAISLESTFQAAMLTECSRML